VNVRRFGVLKADLNRIFDCRGFVCAVIQSGIDRRARYERFGEALGWSHDETWKRRAVNWVIGNYRISLGQSKQLARPPVMNGR
jgi:hypothetical protein